MRKSLAFLILPALIICSCDRHRLGELPEVQREKTQAEASASPGEEQAPAATPTPANFFSEQKSP